VRGDLTRRVITRLLKEAVVISSISMGSPRFARDDLSGQIVSLRSQRQFSIGDFGKYAPP
jgi:hypothetical protein